MAVSVGYFLSETVIARIQQMQSAARQVAAGQLHTRLPVSGRDEMAQLAGSFNEMVGQLEAADQKKRELDVLRRDLIAWVGHDLRTPLTSIRAIVEALADGLVEDEAQRLRYLRTAQSDIRALSTLIDDLFEMAQMDAGGLRLEMMSVSIADLVSDTLEQFSVQAQQAGVHLEGSASPGADPVSIDVQRIGRVLANLVSNAIRHTPPGGTVTITANRRARDLLVSVKDTGEGIRPEDLPYVFERFYRGEKSRSRVTGGAGLGLAIARGIVELHGGEIGVNSQPGQGTEVWFRLPQ
jgi:signal transduction histidine kinase